MSSKMKTGRKISNSCWNPPPFVYHPIPMPVVVKSCRHSIPSIWSFRRVRLFIDNFINKFRSFCLIVAAKSSISFILPFNFIALPAGTLPRNGGDVMRILSANKNAFILYHWNIDFNDDRCWWQVGRWRTIRFFTKAGRDGEKSNWSQGDQK